MYYLTRECSKSTRSWFFFPPLGWLAIFPLAFYFQKYLRPKEKINAAHHVAASLFLFETKLSLFHEILEHLGPGGLTEHSGPIVGYVGRDPPAAGDPCRRLKKTDHARQMLFRGRLSLVLLVALSSFERESGMIVGT